MELTIKNGMTLHDIQAAFNLNYSFLKIEFFQQSHAKNKLSPKGKRIHQNRVVDSLRDSAAACNVNIDPTRTVQEVENDFWEKAQLSAQIFRKAGNLWIETSLTDHWSLEKQNHEGEMINQPDTRSFEQKIEDAQFDNE